MSRSIRLVLCLALLAAVGDAQRKPRGPGGPGGPGSPPTLPPFPALECAPCIEDAAGGPPLRASRTPALGRLLPLSRNLFIDPRGYVGLDSVTPETRLFVGSGNLRVDGAALRVRTGASQPPLLIGTTGTPGARWVDGWTTIVAEGGSMAHFSLAELTLRGADPILGPSVEAERNGGRTLIHAHGPDGAGIELDHLGRGFQLVADRGTGSGHLRMSTDTGALSLDPGTDVDGARLVVAGPTGDDALVARAEDDVLGDGGASLVLSSDEGVDVVSLWSRALGGALRLKDRDGIPRIEAMGENPRGHAVLAMENGDGEGTLTLLSGVPGGVGSSSFVFEDELERPTVSIGGESAIFGPLGNLGLISHRLPTSAGVRTVDLNAPDATKTLEGWCLRLSPDELNFDRLSIRLEAGSVVVPSNDGGQLVVIDESTGDPLLEIANRRMVMYDSSGGMTIENDASAGTKSAVVDTPSFGRRHVYCSEATELWFEDAGRARLEGGSCTVVLDPIFLETVTVDDEHPLHVALSAHGATSGLWVEKHADRFVVHELPDGPADASFDWRVQAKRRGLEDERLALFAAGKDPTR